MGETVTIVVGHSLGKDEAVARLKDGFARAHGQLGSMIAVDEETWHGDTLRFRMRAVGQTATGTIEVMDKALRIELLLPVLLAQAAKWLLPTLQKQAMLLLEKK
jgi:hypothetical protein